MERVGTFNGIGTLMVVLTDGVLVKVETIITLACYRLEH